MDQTIEETKRTRVVGMKWLKLGTDKDPEFGQEYFLHDTDQPKEFYIGMLDSVRQTVDGKRFAFIVTPGGPAIDTFTHYCVPKPPVD